MTNGPALKVIPTFTLLSGYTNIGIALHSAILPCISVTNLATAALMSIENGDYDYCLTYSVSGTTTLASFKVTWG